MTVLQRTLFLLVSIALTGVPLAFTSPASASPGASTAALVPCLTDLALRARQGGVVPAWRRHADTADVSQADLDALPARETRPGVVAREVEPQLPATVVIPVHVHVIKGRHKGERKPIGPRRAQNLITILNNGMAGKQSPLSAPTRYRFSLKKVDWTKRDGWYHAFFNGPRDRKMKHRLHRGNSRTLNLYINGGGPRDYPVLGYSRFPWQYAGAPYLDGVTINVDSLPGGRATNYNLGDTVIHETGHWLGLLHTFQGGCDGGGDLVTDTPAEAEPSFYCQTTRDTCPAPGLDPVHNFMDYSQDACMDMLTPGQVRRIDTAFEKWRM